MPTEENPHAGKGAVVLDIGGEVGALIVVMPAEMEDLEVEIIPTGTDARPPDQLTDDLGAVDPRHVHPHLPGHPGHSHDDHSHGDHDHDHDHSHDDHDHSHQEIGADPQGPGAAAPPHVAVVARPTPNGTVVHSLVYGSLAQGTYDLYVRPFGRVHLTATVVGGQVTEAHWV